MNSARDNVHSHFGGQVARGDIAPYVFVPGSKARVKAFAEHWENAHQVAEHYEYLIYTGELNGIPVSACSTGIGGMSVSIAIEELARLGADTFLRVGVTSPLVDELDYGDLVIATGAVRWDGTSQDYVRPEYPAVASFEVVMACIAAAEKMGFPYKVGIMGDMASLGPMRTDGFRKFLTRRTQPMLQELYEMGVLDGTGEAATMMVQASIFGLRSGVININSADPENERWDPEGEKKAVTAGIEAMRILMSWDQEKEAEGAPFKVPSVIRSSAGD